MLIRDHFLLAGVIASMLGCVESAEQVALRHQQETLIYGPDDRLDVRAEPNPVWRERAQGAIVALMLKRSLRIDENQKVRLGERTLDARYALCDGERYAAQPALADCSATLIDEDLVLTAGHCFESDSALECQGYHYVFDYAYTQPDGLEDLDASDVYACKRIVARKVTSVTPLNAIDYAVVQLDRPVGRDRAPLTLSARAPAEGETLTVMGFPSGLPLKIDHGGRVRPADTESTELFSLDSDTFRASSGSGVFDAEGLLVGSIVSGGVDYTYFEDAGCQRTRKVDASIAQSPFERALYAQYVIDDLCRAGWPDLTLCNRAPMCGDGFCSRSERNTCPSECGEPLCDGRACASLSDAGPGRLDAARAEPGPESGDEGDRRDAPSGHRESGCAAAPPGPARHPTGSMLGLLLALVLRRRRQPRPGRIVPNRLRDGTLGGMCVLAFAACHREKPSPAPGGYLDAGSNGVAARCLRNDPLRQAYFGDLHVHTALSLDANLQGTRLRPTDAYRFARGERVALPPYDDDGKPSRTLALDRPLDFVALSDHAEFLGLVTTCLAPDLPGYASEACVEYRAEPDRAFTTLNARLAASQESAGYGAPCTKENGYCGSAAMSAWREVIDAAEAANDTTDACSFSAFVAYEWSASPGLSNLHRNVIFRGSDVPTLPFSYFDGSEEEALWDALERDCTRAAGCDVLTVPHNSNLSAGLMFEPVKRAGGAFDAAYAKRRASFEPLVEIFQHKGSSECLPEQGPDELCNFELLPYNNLATVALGGLSDTLVPSDYLRHTLSEGLRLQQKLGANPFAYGFVASTDSHLGLAGGVDELDFQGHGGAGSNARTTLPSGLVDHAWLNPGGLAVLWAEENSRDSLFEAMRRREAYATSGPRILLRFFGGAELSPELCGAKDFVRQGYADGVPMGGELAPLRSGKAPRFAVWALRDPGTKARPGGLLQRIQIIKGFLKADDSVAYRVYNVAGDASNGASVRPGSCEPTGEGADELCNVWTDPEFDAREAAFYYARVIENPSCRWHQRACLAAGVKCEVPETITKGFEDCCGNYPPVQQERAWSSPIFYRAP